MMLSSFRFLLLYLSVASAVEQQELLEWVRSCGGFFSQKQVLRNEVPGDSSSLFGVFAAEPIEREEVLASIPWDCILHARSNHRFENCDTVERLAKEMREPSDFALYVESLADTAEEHAKLLPANWSEEGKALLLQMTGNGVLPPNDPFMLNFEWKKECENNNDPLHKAATSLVITHGEDFGFVPIIDKYNNRGGRWKGAYYSTFGGDGQVGLEVRAFRDINVGEQIYTDYRDYGAIGTPELLRDYGFVERLPQRWIFHEQEVSFDIDDKRGNGNIQVTWTSDVCPSELAEEFFHEQLTRLEQHVSPEIMRAAKKGSVPKHELETISQFHDALITAMGLASRFVGRFCKSQKQQANE